jgi:hypothetical protein
LEDVIGRTKHLFIRLRKKGKGDSWSRLKELQKEERQAFFYQQEEQCCRDRQAQDKSAIRAYLYYKAAEEV